MQERLELGFYLSQGYQCDMKCKQPRLGLELALQSTFPTIMTFATRSIPKIVDKGCGVIKTPLTNTMNWSEKAIYFVYIFCFSIRNIVGHLWWGNG